MEGEVLWVLYICPAICSLSLVSNAYLIFAITRSRKTATNQLIRGLAVADITSAVATTFHVFLYVFGNVHLKYVDKFNFIFYCGLSSALKMASQVALVGILYVLVGYLYFRNGSGGSCLQFGTKHANVAVFGCFFFGLACALKTWPRNNEIAAKDCILNVMPLTRNVTACSVIYLLTAVLLCLYNDYVYKPLPRYQPMPNKFKILFWVLILHCIVWMPDLYAMLATHAIKKDIYPKAHYLAFKIYDFTYLLALCSSTITPIAARMFPDVEDFQYWTRDQEISLLPNLNPSSLV